MGALDYVRGAGRSVKEWLSYDPEGKTVKFSSIALNNTEGHEFAHFVPSIYNFASACASGNFVTATTPDELKNGAGNLARILRQQARLASDLAEAKSKQSDPKSDKLTQKIQELTEQWNAVTLQATYVRGLALNFVHFEVLTAYQEYQLSVQNAEAGHLERKEDWSGKRQQKKLETKRDQKKKAFEALCVNYETVLKREAISGQSILQSNVDEKMVDMDKAAKFEFAIRPGMFASHDEADLACQVMAARLRGNKLPKDALILLPENPSHKKLPGYVKTPKALKSVEPTEFPEITVTMTRKIHQFTISEHVAPVLATVLGFAFTVVTAAMMGAFIFLLFTPLGAPLWAVGLMTAAVFAVDLLNNRDDWQGRTTRIIDPFKRAWNSLFHRNSFEHRVNERLSIGRALLTGFVALFIGFDLGLIGTGAALGLGDFWKDQALAKVHPVGMIVMLVVFAFVTINSMIAPLFGEAFSRIGLFFRQPIEKHKVKLDIECELMMKNEGYLHSNYQSIVKANRVEAALAGQALEPKILANDAVFKLSAVSPALIHSGVPSDNVVRIDSLIPTKNDEVLGISATSLSSKDEKIGMSL